MSLLKSKKEAERHLRRVTKHRIEIWYKEKVLDELLQENYLPRLFKTIRAEIVPQTGRLQNGQVETILSKVTHKVIVRHDGANDVTHDMWIMFRGRKFDIKYILKPYEDNEWLEMFCEEVLE